MNSSKKADDSMQEGSDNKLKKASSSSRSHWGGFRNPRIVRVSRSFGGKDRHSKVCTVRGLRDRRIRLSVPTAIQLYGLQDKLGLNQPSKVVDWLLDATKNDIDKLPPLQMPQENLGQFFNPLLQACQQSSSSSSIPNFFNPSSSYSSSYVNDHTMMDRSNYSIHHGDSSRNVKLQVEKDKWIVSNDQENQDGTFEGYASQITAQNFFPICNQSSFPNLLTSSLPYNHPYYQLDANSNLSLSQIGSNNMFSNHQTDNHQLYFRPSSTTILTNVNPPLMESTSDPNRQINHFQFLNSSSQQFIQNPLIPTLHFISSPMQSNLFNVNPKNLDPQETDKNEGGMVLEP